MTNNNAVADTEDWYEARHKGTTAQQINLYSKQSDLEGHINISMIRVERMSLRSMT